ncbi:MAG: saccharopine dehydrogenase C-terminal domain-containing protein [Actinomycetota bacterium]
MSLDSIAVLGLGKVGHLAATFLHHAGVRVIGVDVRPPRGDSGFEVHLIDAADRATLRAELVAHDGVLSCLPYHLNKEVAALAHELGIHYFDLTEDVSTTRTILELAPTSKGVMAPQCGLAPGFVGIIAASQVESFDVCRAVRMRVGALPQHPTGLLGYAFNWSPEGVVNEYLNDCEVIEAGQRKWVSPMEWRESLYVNGVKLEAFTTSGGLGTMCDTYHGRVANIDYKTIRYPGHMELMNFFFHELLLRDERTLAGRILTNAKPPVNDDVVYIHVSSEGTINEQLRRVEFVRGYMPREVDGIHRTAIAWTTAGSVAAVIEMVRNGSLPQQGFIKQESIHIEAFLATPTSRLFS